MTRRSIENYLRRKDTNVSENQNLIESVKHGESHSGDAKSPPPRMDAKRTKKNNKSNGKGFELKP